MRKKKNKKRLIENLVIFGFFLILTSFLDITIDKSGVTLVAHENSLYKVINSKEMINALEGETGVYLIVNDDKYINKITNILNSLKTNENIYVYNSDKDEIKLEKKNNKIKIIQNSTLNYNTLLKQLGAYKDNYVIDGEITNYFIINTPTVLFIKEGDIVYSYYLIDTSLNDEVLSETYSKGFELLNDDSTLISWY